MDYFLLLILIPWWLQNLFTVALDFNHTHSHISSDKNWFSRFKSEITSFWIWTLAVLQRNGEPQSNLWKSRQPWRGTKIQVPLIPTARWISCPQLEIRIQITNSCKRLRCSFKGPFFSQDGGRADYPENPCASCVNKDLTLIPSRVPSSIPRCNPVYVECRIWRRSNNLDSDTWCVSTFQTVGATVVLQFRILEHKSFSMNTFLVAVIIQAIVQLILDFFVDSRRLPIVRIYPYRLANRNN